MSRPYDGCRAPPGQTDPRGAAGGALRIAMVAVNLTRPVEELGEIPARLDAAGWSYAADRDDGPHPPRK